MAGEQQRIRSTGENGRQPRAQKLARDADDLNDKINADRAAKE
jgi:hypothetical protein